MTNPKSDVDRRFQYILDPYAAVGAEIAPGWPTAMAKGRYTGAEQRVAETHEVKAY